MTRRAYIYFILTFVLGVFIGAAGAFFYGWHSGRWHRPFDRHRMVRHLRHDLNLNDSQTQQLDQILQETGKKYSDLEAKMDPEFEAVRQATRDRIRAILNPQQLVKFNELVRRFDESRKGHGPP